MKRLKILMLFVCVVCLLTLSGCADTVPITFKYDIPLVGFWHGLWHGLTFGFAFIGSLFSDQIAIYAVYNNGGWYDFGFWLGIIILVGGGGSSSKRRG